MSTRITFGAIYIALAVCCLAISAAYAHGPGNEWIMQNRPGCCGDEDCREVKVRYTPHGYLIYAIVPMKGRAAVHLSKPILVPEHKWISFPQREFRACFHTKKTAGGIVTTGLRCFFQPNGGG